MEGLFPNFDLIWYLGYFVPVLSHFVDCKNPSTLSINKNPASRNINKGKANQKTFLVAERSSTSRGKANRNKKFSMPVSLSAKTVPMMSQPTVKPVAGPSRALFLAGLCGLTTREIIPRARGPRGEHRARGTEESNENNIEGARRDAEVPGLAQAKLKRLEGREPVAATLASLVSSLLLSRTSPIPAFEEMAKVVDAKVKA